MTAEPFETVEEEYDYLLGRMRDIEAELMNYSAAQFGKRQVEIRAEYRPKSKDESFQAWIAERTRMEDARRELVKRKMKVQARIALIKPQVMAERLAANRKSNGSLIEEVRDLAEVMIEIRDILVDIRWFISDYRGHGDGADDEDRDQDTAEA